MTFCKVLSLHFPGWRLNFYFSHFVFFSRSAHRKVIYYWTQDLKGKLYFFILLIEKDERRILVSLLNKIKNRPHKHTQNVYILLQIFQMMCFQFIQISQLLIKTFNPNSQILIIMWYFWIDIVWTIEPSINLHLIVLTTLFRRCKEAFTLLDHK